MLVISESYMIEMLRAVRVSRSATSEEEVDLLIQAAGADLNRRGVNIVDPEDPLTKQAIKLYCKGHYGYDKDSERFQKAYEALADGMSLSGDYEGGDQNG